MTQADSAQRLTAQQLADAAPVPVVEVERLAEVGMLRPDADGRYSLVDVQRVRAVMAMRSPGIELAQLLPAFREGLFTLEPIDMLFPEPPVATKTTWRDVAASAGVEQDQLMRLVVAAGFPMPDPDDLVREDDAGLVRDILLAGELMGGGEITLRMARLFGEAARRSAEAGLALFDEGDDIRSRPHQRLMRDPVARREMNERGGRLMRLSEDVLARLFRRHLEYGLLSTWAAAAEVWLDELGIRPTVESPPAVAFVDLSGYTRMTEEAGDATAAQLAARLAELAELAAAQHSGRVVKLLGDGAMLHFAEPLDAVRGALRLIGAVEQSGLPSAHGGVHAGPVIRRDGDYFGRTVNLAARISALAQPGEVWTTAQIADRAAPDLRFDPVGTPRLKGIGPLPLFSARRL